VRTSWVSADGKRREGASTKKLFVSLPTDFEPVGSLLLNALSTGPELLSSRPEELSVTACGPDSVLLAGRRLWRSAVVTLGAQPASSMTVLPNMKGLIANFDYVRPAAARNKTPDQSTQTRSADDVPTTEIVRVWTSEGSVILSTPVRIVMPESCRPEKASRRSTEELINGDKRCVRTLFLAASRRWQPRSAFHHQA